MPSGGTQQGGAMRDAPPPHSIAGKVKQPARTLPPGGRACVLVR